MTSTPQRRYSGSHSGSPPPAPKKRRLTSKKIVTQTPSSPSKKIDYDQMFRTHPMTTRSRMGMYDALARKYEYQFNLVKHARDVYTTIYGVARPRN